VKDLQPAPGFTSRRVAAFDRIAAGLDEALEIAKGSAKPARLYVPAEMPFTSPNAETEGLLFFNLRGGFKGLVQSIAKCESGTVPSR